MRSRLFVTLCLFVVVGMGIVGVVEVPKVRAQSLPTAMVHVQELGLWPFIGDVPWIELFNAGPDSVDVSGWKLVANGSDLMMLGGVSLAAGEYRVVFDQQWPVFSSAGKIELVDGANSVVDSFVWNASPAAGASLARAETGFTETFLTTAGRPNVVAARDLVCAEPVEPAPVNNTATTGNIRLNELFPDPDGDETMLEFIELYNADAQPIRLQGWKVSDPVKTYVLPDVTLAAQQYWVIYRPESAITLNNDKDTVTLTDPTGLVVHQFAYASTVAEKSWNYGADWYLGAPSPNDVNVALPAAPVPDPTPTPTPAPTPTPTPSPTPEPSPAPQPSAPPTVLLTELYPVPASGEEEWIEVLNTSTEPVSLQGLSITDGVRTFTFATNDTIGGSSYLLIPQSVSAIQLNNSGDHVMLVFGGNIIDETTYGAITTGKSWSRLGDGTWEISAAPTPGTGNFNDATEPAPTPEAEGPSAPAESTTAAKAAGKTTKVAAKKVVTYQPITFAGWFKAAPKSLVQIEAMVSVPSGDIKKRTAYLQPLNGNEPGIEVYFSKAEPESLAAGDVVIISGEKSVSSRGERLLVRAPEDVETTGSDEIRVETALWSERNASWHNRIVSVAGTIIESNSRGMKIDQDGEEITVIYKSYKPEPIIKEGSVVLAGLYRHDVQQLWVYNAEMVEFVVEESDAHNHPVTIAQGSISAPPKPEKSRGWVYVLGTAGASGVASWYLSADSAKRAIQLVAGYFRK